MNVEPDNAGHAVPIVKSTANGRLEIEDEDLKSILHSEEIEDLPLSIISIAGDFRTGKSFLLNFFLHQLQNKNDLKELENCMKFGFHWVGGDEKDTSGIWMWSKPFIIYDDQQKKVAILLVDTQGNFDHGSAMDLNCKVFALSTILSTTLLYNIQNKLHKHTLEYLQYFVTYTESRLTEDSEKPFQVLSFVIRDWQWPAQHPYGMVGGMNYINGVWSTSDHRCTDGIKEVFDKTACFLLPYPGSKVSSCMGMETLSVGDVDSEFLNQAGKLVHATLHGEYFARKRLQGTGVTGQSLLKYLTKCCEILNKGCQLPLPTIKESIISFQCNRYVDKARKIYEKTMSIEGLKDWQEFDENHKVASNLAKEYFQVHAGPKEYSQYSQKLEKKLKKEREKLIEPFSQKRKNDAIKKCTKIAQEFKSKMEQIKGWAFIQTDIDKFYTEEGKRLKEVKSHFSDPRDHGEIKNLAGTAQNDMKSAKDRREERRDRDRKDAICQGARYIGGCSSVVSAVAAVACAVVLGPVSLLIGGAATGVSLFVAGIGFIAKSKRKQD